MAEAIRKKKGKKQRKYDRNRIWCKSYAARGQRRTNKLKKIRKHLKRFPHDEGAKEALRRVRIGDAETS